jgi:hypothetical protein
MDEPDWWSLLRALDQPVEPPDIPLESVIRPVEGVPGKVVIVGSMPESVKSALNERAARGEGDGLEVPRDFDLAAARGRFDRLVERLSEACRCPCESGLAQNSARFGTISISADATPQPHEGHADPVGLERECEQVRRPRHLGPCTPGGQTPYTPSTITLSPGPGRRINTRPRTAVRPPRTDSQVAPLESMCRSSAVGAAFASGWLGRDRMTIMPSLPRVAQRAYGSGARSSRVLDRSP